MITLDSTLKIGDILTSVSILVSILALLAAWAKDRRIRTKELADRIRSAAAHALAKLERWKEISLSIVDEAQSAFVETSEMIEPTEKNNIIAARDYLWKEMSKLRAEALRRILDEEVEVAYIELYAYKTGIRDIFIKALSELKDIDSDVYVDFIERAQDTVMSFRDPGANYTTAMLGDALRADGWSFIKTHGERTRTALGDITTVLADLISTSDTELLKGAND